MTNRKMQTAKIGILLLPTMSMIFYKIYLIRHTPNARIGPGSDFGSYEYLLTQFRVITKYIALLFFPINQNFDYDFAISKGFLSPQSTLFSFIVFLYLMVTVFLLYKRWRLFSFAILWFFIILAPTSGIIPITEVIMEHRVYLASVGFFLLFAIGLYHIYTSFLRGHESGFAILAILILMMTLTYLTTKRNMVWTNTIAFWEDVVKKSPLNVRPHIALGIAYHEKGFNDLAINEYSKATALADDREKPNSMLALALLYAESGRDKEALLEMDKSLKLNPEKTPDLYYVIGMFYALTGYWEEAVKNYKNALNQNPNFVVARYEMGNLYRVKRLYDNALSEYIEILKIDPNSAKAYNDMGVVYGEIGMFDEAERNYLLALKLNPKFSSAIKNLKTVVELKNEKFKK
ncbi:MAG: tetratricopeptide repeat protein [Nitrospirae bacterium]|nr:tetratricopeptide repeat protein [Nitrospirota bacterium]